MQSLDADIAIAGGGVAGLSAACAFGAAGFSVICIDPAPPVTAEAEEGADLRTTAFLQPARALLERAGLWARLEPHAAALQVMRIVDAGGQGHEAREIADFDAAEISGMPFGWNLPNWLLRREMLARIETLGSVAFLPGIGATGLITRGDAALLRLSDGRRLRARLLLAADGRDSLIRRALGIGVRTWRYGQKALAFSVSHPRPHENVSTEIHRSGGPFTLVPLPDLDGTPRSAVVWMERGPRIAALAALPVAEFEAEMTARSAALFGPLKLLGRRTVWPIISQRAQRLVGQRSALIAEAAHVVPPIGAQGLNMSLKDIATLLDLATAAPGEIGSPEMLARYQRRRLPDILARVKGIDLLNRSAMAEAAPLRELRRQGLNAIHRIMPLRRALMQAGLGARPLS